MAHPSDFDSAEKAADTFRDLLLEIGRRRSLRDPLAHICEEFGLTPPQIHTLFWLATDGALTMGELARRIGISEKTVTGLVDRLERDGHLKRERGEQDRRVVHAALTRRGQALAKKIVDASHEQFTVMMSLLAPGDRAELYRIIQSITQRMAELGNLKPEPTEEP